MKTGARLLAATAVAALAGGAAASEAASVDVGTAKRQHSIVTKVKTTRKVVYLTFDDGPSVYTPQIISTLNKYKARATFFEVGSQVRRYPATAMIPRRTGHKVANHTYSHPMLTKRSNSSIRSELRRTDAAIGFRPKCMRPPYGSIDSRVHGQVALYGKTPVKWTFHVWDWDKPGLTFMKNRIIKQTTSGSIILLHDGGGNRTQTLQLVKWAVPYLKSKGYALETLPMC